MDGYLVDYNSWKYELVDSIKDKFKKRQNLKGEVNTALSKVYFGNQRMQGLESNDKNALKNVFGLSDEYFNGEDTSKQNLIAFINTINEGLPLQKKIIIPNVEKSSTQNVIDNVSDDEGGFFGAWFGNDDGDYGGSKMKKRKTKRRKTNKKSKRKRRKTRRRQR